MWCFDSDYPRMTGTGIRGDVRGYTNEPTRAECSPFPPNAPITCGTHLDVYRRSPQQAYLIKPQQYLPCVSSLGGTHFIPQHICYLESPRRFHSLYTDLSKIPRRARIARTLYVSSGVSEEEYIAIGSLLLEELVPQLTEVIHLKVDVPLPPQVYGWVLGALNKCTFQLSSLEISLTPNEELKHLLEKQQRLESLVIRQGNSIPVPLGPGWHLSVDA